MVIIYVILLLLTVFFWYQHDKILKSNDKRHWIYYTLICFIIGMLYGCIIR